MARDPVNGAIGDFFLRVHAADSPEAGLWEHENSANPELLGFADLVHPRQEDSDQ